MSRRVPAGFASVLLFAAACGAQAAGPPRTATLPAASRVGTHIAYCAETERGGEVRILHLGQVRTIAGPGVPASRLSFRMDDLAVRYTTSPGESLLVWEVPVIGRSGPTILARLRAKSVAISSDDAVMAWTEGSWTRNRLWLADADRSHARVLPDTTSAWYNLAWSPSRRTLSATRRDRSGTLSIWLVPVQGDPRPLRDGLPAELRPQAAAWSPDGSRLAFQAGKHDPKDAARTDVYLWVADVASGRARRIGEHLTPCLDEAPTWLDRDHVAFQSTRSGRFEIWSMRTDGRELRCLTCP